MNCIICGCTHDSACWDADFGSCGWDSYHPPLCSHCTDPQFFLGCMRLTENLKRIRILTGADLKEVFQAMHYQTTVSRLRGSNNYLVKLQIGDRDDFTAILKAWYPDLLEMAAGGFKINTAKHALLKQRKELVK